MVKTEGYITVIGETEAEYTEKRSRFIATLKHCETEEEAAEFINALKSKYWDARHNCYAYSVENGALKRFSDDGEPHGTAGKPILSVIDGAGITNVCIVVTRYFGGVLLGTGGLVRAYTKAASDAAAKIAKAVMTPGTVFSAECDYSAAERLEKLIFDAGGSVENTVYAENVRYEFFISDTEKQKFTERLKEVFCARITAVSLSVYMVKSTEKSIFTAETFKSEKKADCILILGAGVKDGKPKPMLRDRLLTGIELYKSGAADKIIMSGDHGRADYDEVNVMRSFAIEQGVRAEDIFLDHAGFSTYDSVYRAKNIFGAESIITVSQKYHLYRALYISEKLDVKAAGVAADLNPYGGQLKRDIREIIARDKDFFKCIIKPEAEIMGDKIPLDGDGSITLG